MDLKKLEEILAAKGIPEEKIDEIVAELKSDEKEDEEEKGEEESKGSEDGKAEEELPPSTEDAPSEEDDLPPGSHDGTPSEQSVAPQDDADIPPSEELPPVDEPPVPPTDELPPDPSAEEVPPSDVSPIEDAQPEPPAPSVDPSVLDDLLGKLEESNKTIEGLLARVDSLEQALKSAGVLDESETVDPVGDDNPRNLENGSIGASDDFDDALSALNGKRRY